MWNDAAGLLRRYRSEGSALALLVPGVVTDDHDVAVATNHLALVTDLLDTRLDLHHAEHRIRQGFDNRAFDFDDAVLLRHILRLSSTTFSDSNGLRPFGIAPESRHTAPKDTSKGRAYAILALLGKLDAVSIASRLMLASYQHRYARDTSPAAQE